MRMQHLRCTLTPEISEMRRVGNGPYAPRLFRIDIPTIQGCRQ